MNIANIMSHITLRQMGEAQKVWREHVGPAGPKYQTALADENVEAMACMIVAKMRATGQPGFTVDDALDLELDSEDDAAGEPTSANGSAAPALSLEPGA